MMDLRPSFKKPRSNRARILLRQMGMVQVPPLFSAAKLSDFDFPTQDLVWKSLFLTGSRGVGKTHLMAALVRQQISDMLDEAGPQEVVTILFSSIPEILLEIRESFKDKSQTTEAQIIDKYTKVGWLFLDDLGVEKPTEWVLQTLYLIIDRRYRNMKHTVVSSNYSLQELSDRLDDRISSRIAGMCRVCRLSGNDRRLLKR